MADASGSYHAATSQWESLTARPQLNVPTTTGTATEGEGAAEVRGSPENAPENYDFVLPGSYVPPMPASLNFAATWDGALRVRDAGDDD